LPTGHSLVIPDIVDVIVVNAIAVLDFFMEEGMVDPGGMLIMVDVAGSRFSVDVQLAQIITFYSYVKDLRSATTDAMEDPKRAKAISENFMMNVDKEVWW
jgi:hypothetical protein